jgi:hypothetical protein
MKCANCRTDLAAGDSFCGECGHPIAPTAPTAPPVATAVHQAPSADALATTSAGRPARSSLEWVIGSLGAVSLAGLSIAGVSRFLQDEPQPAHGSSVSQQPAAPRQPAPQTNIFDTPSSDPSETAIISEASGAKASSPTGGGTAANAPTADLQLRDEAISDVFKKRLESGVPAGGADQSVVTRGLEERSAQDEFGWYVVVTSTLVRHDPRPDAEALGELQPATRVRVTGGVGDYLEVRSVLGGRNGYALRRDLRFVEPER